MLIRESRSLEHKFSRLTTLPWVKGSIQTKFIINFFCRGFDSLLAFLTFPMYQGSYFKEGGQASYHETFK